MTKKRSAPKQPAASANVVVDLSHHNADPDFVLARDTDGIIGVIHEATQGVTYTDPTFSERQGRRRPQP